MIAVNLHSSKKSVAVPALAACAAAIFGAASCGYRPVHGKVPGGGSEVCVPVVKNATAYAGLTSKFTSVLRKRVATSGIEVKGKGSPRLEVTIVRIEGGPGMVIADHGGLVPLERLWRIKATASLIAAGGKDLFGPESFEAVGRSYSGGNPLAEESLGQRRLHDLLDDLSEEITSRIFERPGG